MDCNLFTSIDQQTPPDLLITPSDQRAPMASATLTVAANKYTCSLPLSSSSSSSAASSSRIQSILMSQPPKRSILPLTASSSSSSSSSLGISETFSNLKKQGKVAFIPYITAGDPDLATTAQALKLLSSMGADVIELGLPYSDPVLDGPVIQASNKRALANKTTTQAVISMLEEVIPQISCPVVIFSYSNLVLGSKSKWFLSALQGGGVKGLIVPDLPFEESAALRKEAAKKDIDMILLTTPTTTVKKRKAIADASQGFMYLVSSVGVTGARHTVNAQVEYLLKEIKEETSKPVAVGFGISKPEHVKQISSWGADGVIVGSAIVKLLGEAKSSEEGLRHVESFVASLRAALPSGHNAPAFAEEHSSKVNVFQESRWLWQEQRVASSLPFLRECHLSVGSVHDASRSR